MFNRIIERINRKRHYGLNDYVWDWLKHHAKEANLNVIDYLFKYGHSNYVIVDYDGKSKVYASGFETYIKFDSRGDAEYYARKNHLKNLMIIDELDFLKKLGLDTDIVFNLNRLRKFFKQKTIFKKVSKTIA